MLKSVLTTAAIGAAMLAVTSPAQAQGGVKVGTLTCHVAPGWGFIVGSSRRVKCLFEPTAFQWERYTGSISKFGVDIGYKNHATLIWAVFNPTTQLEPGALQGHYG